MKLTELSTGVLRGMDRFLDGLPVFVMPGFRLALKLELLARDLPKLADDSGGHIVAPITEIQ